MALQGAHGVEQWVAFMDLALAFESVGAFAVASVRLAGMGLPLRYTTKELGVRSECLSVCVCARVSHHPRTPSVKTLNPWRNLYK